MKQPYPRNLQIGGHTYTVSLCPTLAQTEGSLGEHRPYSHEIVIQDQRDGGNMTVTLLHEVIEAVNRIYLNGELEHRFIDPLAEGLYQVLSQMGIDIDWNVDE